MTAPCVLMRALLLQGRPLKRVAERMRMSLTCMGKERGGKDDDVCSQLETQSSRLEQGEGVTITTLPLLHQT